jgi:protocatechuate 3,4-dioxygenase beta subunit
MNSSPNARVNGAILKAGFTPCLLLLLSAAWALSAQSAETFRLAGKVVDEKSQPVAGAVLEAYEVEGSPVQATAVQFNQKLTTGADGRFEMVLPRQSVEVLVRKAGLAPTWWTLWGQDSNGAKDQTNETLVLTAPAVLAGTVVDEADKPVANAEVWVSKAYLERQQENVTSYAYLHDKPAREAFSVRTTAEGKFRIENFPASASADLGVAKAGKVLRPISRRYMGPDTLFHPGEEDIKLVVEPAGSIEGKVLVQETGKPLAGARFSLTHNQPGYSGAQPLESVRSGADGSFVVPDITPGNYMLQATLGTNAVPEWVAEPVAVTVEASKTTRDVQIGAVAGGFLKVVVLGKEDMSFVSQANVQISKGAFHSSGTTSTNGAALFRLPAGTYHVFATRGEARAEGVSLTIESGETNRHEFLLNPPPRLVGTVRDPAGQPARGLPVAILGSFGPNTSDIKTDDKGHFEIPFNPQRFSGMNNATPCLMVRDSEHNLAATLDIEPSKKPLELKLEPGLVVTGKVEDPKGKPLTNATIQVYLWFGNMGTQFGPHPVPVDPQGRFEVSGLPADRRYSVSADAKGYGSASQNIEREDSSTNRVELAALVLQRADQQLAGQVVDADDKPVAGARVYIYGQGQPNTSARSDAKGHFKFEAVCEGAVQVSANARETYGSTSAQAGATDVVVRLGARQSQGVRAATPSRTALKGKALPDLAEVHLSGEACPAGKAALLCLFDLEQRPSRRALHALAEQYEALKQKDLTVLGLQATVTTAEAFKELKDSNPAPFPVGYVSEKSDKTRWASGVETLPWLILTDKEHRVVAEGFSLEELDAQLKALAK